jgi:hypothetical protein
VSKERCYVLHAARCMALLTLVIVEHGGRLHIASLPHILSSVDIQLPPNQHPLPDTMCSSPCEKNVCDKVPELLIGRDSAA